MKSGELGDRKLLGAGVRAKLQRGEGRTKLFRFGARLQVVHQRLALLRETQFHKFEKADFVFEMEIGALSRKAQCDKRGSDFRRRMECSARNLENDFRARVKLRHYGKIAVIARAGPSGKALRDFGLNDKVHFVDLIREREKVMEDRRGNVVRKIAVNSHAAACELSDIGLQDVLRRHGEIGEIFREAAQAADKRRIQFDGVDRSARGE